MKEIRAGLSTGGIDGSWTTFDLKSPLCCMFNEGLNQWISCFSSALQRNGGTGTYRNVKCSIPIVCRILYKYEVPRPVFTPGITCVLKYPTKHVHCFTNIPMIAEIENM